MLLSIALFLILYFVSIQSLKSRVDFLELKVKKLEGGVVTPIAAATPVSPTSQVAPLSAPQSQPVTKEETHAENFGSILAKVGIAILILGIGFFLNYINSKGLLSYNVKFIIGLLVGGVMIGIAEYLKIKTQKYAEIVRGGGFVVWFLSIFIGSMIYGLFSIPVALSLTLAVVVISFLISLREKSETTFFIGVLGGYLVPLIAGFYSNDANAVAQMLLYICMLNIGIVIASRTQDWMKTMTVGFIFSWLILLSFYGAIDVLGWQMSWFFTTVVGLTYLIVFIQGDIKRSRESENMKPSIILSILNTGIYTSIAYSILSKTPVEPYLGFLIAVLGLIHLGVYVYIRNTTNASDHPSALAHFVLFTALLTAAVPVQFDGPIVTMIWFVEGIIISYLATLKDFRGNMIMYVLGLVGIIGGILHMGMFGNYTEVHETGLIFLNQKYLVWLFVIVLTQGIAYIWKISVQEEGIVPAFKTSILSAVVFLVLAGQVAFMGLTLNDIDGLKTYKSNRIYESSEAKMNDFEKYYGNTQPTEEQMLQSTEFARARQTEQQELNRNFSLLYIIFFTIMTSIYLVIGLMRNNKAVRRLGVVTLIITILQLFSLAWSLGPVFRIGAFVGLGIVILLLGYFYTRYSKKPSVPAATTALMLLLSLALGTATHAAVVNPTEWSSMSTVVQAETSASTDSWYVAPIEPSIWSRSQRQNYADIRIVNTANEEIPYVILKQGAVAKTEAPIQNTNSQAKIVENTLQPNQGTPERVIVLDTGKEGQVYTGISFDRIANARNFRKVAHVYISDTLLGASSPAWREIEQRSVVYNYTDPTGFSVEDMEVHFPNLASRYIKVRFENDAALKDKGVEFSNQIGVSGARIEYEARDTAVGTKIENYLSGNFEFSGTPAVTSMKIDSMTENAERKSTEIHLRDVQAITSIKLYVDEKQTNFNRDVTVQGSTDNVTWQTVTTGQIYRIESPVYTGEMLTIKTAVMTYPYVRIIIQNKNDVALKMQNTVDVTAQKIGILFKAEGVDVRTLKLLIGNKNAVTPTYEIEKTLAYFNNVVPIRATFGAIDKNPIYETEKIHVPFGEKYKSLVNIALVVFVALLAYLGYSWTRKA